MKIIFNSDRFFNVFDVLVSHGQLLIRSQKDENYNYNIDIIFFDTRYIQLLSKLSGVSVRRIHDTNAIGYDSVRKYLSNGHGFLFEIESGAEKYYIVASFVRVFQNEQDFNESSLNFENKGRKGEIASSE